MSKSVLILGGKGFLGSALRRAFSADPNFEVFISSREGDPTDPHHLKVDLLKAADIAGIGTYDIVINATGQVANPVALCVALNTTGIQNVLEAVASPNTLFIQISTTQVYGTATEVHEHSPLQPETEYAKAKISAEEQVRSRMPEDGHLILRLCNLYGAGQGKGLLWHLRNSLGKKIPMKFADNDGSLRRNFLHVDDAATMIHQLVSRGASGVFNVASRENYSIKELIALLEKIHGRSIPVTYAHVLPLGNIDAISTKMIEQVVPLSCEHSVEEYLKNGEPEVLGIITARGGSKRLPRKNVMLLNGKPMIAYTCEAALGSKLLTRVVLSTDDEEIAKVARNCGVEVLMRPAELALDDTSSMEVIRHVLGELEKKENYKPSAFVILQPTSPFRTSTVIDEGIVLLQKSGAETVVSVTPMEKGASSSLRQRIIDGKLIPANPDEKDGKFYDVNGALYVMTAAAARFPSFQFGDSRPLLMAPEDSIDLDTPEHFALAENLLKKQSRNS